jgi:hypothetical protein
LFNLCGHEPQGFRDASTCYGEVFTRVPKFFHSPPITIKSVGAYMRKKILDARVGVLRVVAILMKPSDADKETSDGCPIEVTHVPTTKGESAGKGNPMPVVGAS